MTLQALIAFFQRIIAALTSAQPLALLAARGYVAQVFFSSGLTKLRDWETTLALFSDEYKVPLLSPEVAAAAGTAGELVLPVLLALGLGGRFAALEHIFWACLLIGVLLWGPGRWSLDRFALPWLQTTRHAAGYTRAA